MNIVVTVKRLIKKYLYIFSILVISSIIIVGCSGTDNSTEDEKETSSQSQVDNDDSTVEMSSLDVLGEDITLSAFNDQPSGMEFTFTAIFWSTREGNYGYNFSFHQQNDDGTYTTASFFVKDSTEENVLSALDEFSYTDEVAVKMDAIFDKTEILVTSNSSQIIYYVSATNAEILDASSTEARDASGDYYYAGDKVALSNGVTYTIVDTGKYTEVNGTYAYVELDIDNQSGSDLVVSNADIRFYADDYLLETGYPLTADDTFLTQTVSNGRKTSGRFYAECSDYDSSVRIEAEIGSVIIVIKDSASSKVNEASSNAGEYEEDVYAEALEYHNLDFETVRNIVTIYVYDEEYVSTLDDVDIYYAFENAIGDQHIMIDMGTRDLYYDTETEIDEIREFLWSSEVSIITQEEAEGLDDYDAVGLYGVMCQYIDVLYAE